jgi:hypothetical protein
MEGLKYFYYWQAKFTNSGHIADSIILKMHHVREAQCNRDVFDRQFKAIRPTKKIFSRVITRRRTNKICCVSFVRPVWKTQNLPNPVINFSVIIGEVFV